MLVPEKNVELFPLILLNAKDTGKGVALITFRRYFMIHYHMLCNGKLCVMENALEEIKQKLCQITYHA